MDAFNALAEPRRRGIVELLAREGRLSAGEIYERFDVTAQAISQHLHILLDAKLVKMEKHSQKHIYSINTKSIHGIEDWAKNVESLWSDSLDRLNEVLESEKKRAKRGE